MMARAQELDEVFGKVADYFAVLSEPSRLKIMHALCEGERSVGQVLEHTGLSQTNASRHLALMRLHGLVIGRRNGKQIYYRIADDTMPDLCRAVCARIATAVDQRGPLKRQLMKLVAAAHPQGNSRQCQRARRHGQAGASDGRNRRTSNVGDQS